MLRGIPAALYAVVVDPSTVDRLDRDLLHALRIDGRVPFRRIGDVLGVGETTVARRYRRLTAGGVRVVGSLTTPRLGYEPWTLRVRCTPDAAVAIARALARRSDTYWVQLMSGGTEISCNAQVASGAERDALLLSTLPRTARVLDVTAHQILRGFVVPAQWAALRSLPDEAVAALRPADVTGEAVALTDTDAELGRRLAADGRASYARLAAGTGRSSSAVARRIDQLRRSGVLRFPVDVPPAVLGYRTEARLWLSVRPDRLVAVAEAMAGHPELTFLAATTGPTNLVAVAACRDSPALYDYLTGRVAALDGITGMETAPVIRTVKRLT